MATVQATGIMTVDSQYESSWNCQPMQLWNITDTCASNPGCSTRVTDRQLW